MKAREGQRKLRVLVSGLTDLPSQTYYGSVTNSAATLSTLTESNKRPNTLFPPADWAPATNAVITVGGRNTVIVDTTVGTAFFRLKQ
jgi:hypothetical protein